MVYTINDFSSKRKRKSLYLLQGIRQRRGECRVNELKKKKKDVEGTKNTKGASKSLHQIKSQFIFFTESFCLDPRRHPKAAFYCLKVLAPGGDQIHLTDDGQLSVKMKAEKHLDLSS